MSSFVDSEFWLSLSFLIIIGLLFFPPIQRRIQNFFMRQRNQVEKDIQNAELLYKQALQAHQAAIKELKIKQDDKELSQQIKLIQKEWNDKCEHQLKRKEQDFEIRQKLMELQVKNHLQEELLNRVEVKITSSQKKKVSEKEITHFIKMMNKNEMALKKVISEKQ